MEKTALKHRISKREKSEIMDNLQKQILSSDCVLIASSEGMKVDETIQLKKGLSPFNSKFKIVKNRLFSMVAKKIKLEELTKFISGTTGILVCPENTDEKKIIDTIKFATNYAKNNPKLKILGGYVFKKIVDLNIITEIAKLPSKDVLLAQFVSLISTPIKNLFFVLNAPSQSLINIISAKSKKIIAEKQK